MMKVHGVELTLVSGKHVYVVGLDEIIKEKQSFLGEKLDKLLAELPACRSCKYLQVFLNIDLMEVSVYCRLYSASPLNDIKGQCCFANKTCKLGTGRRTFD